MKPGADNESLTIPAALLAEIEAAATEEHRSASAILQDAFSRYKRDREWQKIFAYGEARAKELGLTEADIPRLIAEVRAERRHGHP